MAFPKVKSNKKVCVAGLGAVGYPTALHAHNMGFITYGYDVDEEKVSKITEFQAFSEWSEVPESQVYMVCVSTGWKDEKPDMSNIFDVCKKIAGRRRKSLVCIESTVSLGTCRRIAKLFDEVHLVHVPHRYWAEDPVKHGVRQMRVIGALDSSSLDVGKKFYEILEVPLHVVPSLEVAEIVKISENAYRFVEIAFVENLRMICEGLGIPFEGVRRGANTKWNINFLEPRDGIGGECLPKDTRYLSYLAGKSPLLSGSIWADRLYKEYIGKNANKAKTRALSNH